MSPWMSSRSGPLRPAVLAAVLAGVTAGCGGTADDRPPTWSYIAPAIMAPNCATASCHSRGAAVAGLDLSDAERGYESLVNLRLAASASTDPMRVEKPRPMVVPFNPEQSRVIHMLRGDGTRRMPPERPLSIADVRLVEEWILNGARRD